MKRGSVLLLAMATSATAYVPNPIDGPAHHRTDYSNIQFLANQNIAPGLTNADGKVWITADSAPLDAINGAVASWNGIPTTAVHFAPVQSTSLSYSISDGNHVITFADDAFTRSFTNGIVAITQTAFFIDGSIFDTDIFFSPFAQFSTTNAPGTYDLQAVVTHELGHSLGANHTNILSATMYFQTSPQDNHATALTADDAAFVSALYPLATSSGYGTLSGTATISGAPLFGGAITAVDPNTGITVGGFTSLTDGSFSIQVPQGGYYVYVESAGNLALYSLNQPTLSTSFEPAFAGGNSQPSYLQVDAGANVTVNINAAAGVSPIRVPLGAISIAGGSKDYAGTINTGPFVISSGQSVDFLFGNPLSGTLAESNLQIIGPATLRPGSLRQDAGLVLSDGSAVYRFTLDIAPLAANSSATLVIRSGTDILTRSGVFALTRPQSVNAASFHGGAVTPGEILSFFGSHLGPASAANNGGFDANGQLPTSLAGITVTFDQTQAPLFYASSNQINLQVPYQVANQSSTLMTVFSSGTTIGTFTLSVAKAAPGIFVVTNADGSVNGPNAPASVGSVLVIYGTGSGVTTGLVRTGAAAPANSTVPATVTVGGQTFPADYSGLTAGSVGLTQVNVTLPAGTPSGSAIPLHVTVNGVTTQDVTIAVR
jgi:uncharacterized protein (TIGR03437 family)